MDFLLLQTFLADNGLKLILRSHEGPDARFERDDMADMQQGWTTDHQVAAGSLLTVFRSPPPPPPLGILARTCTLSIANHQIRISLFLFQYEKL